MPKSPKIKPRVCTVCGVPYASHSHSPCEICGRDMTHHVKGEVEAERAGKVRMAEARLSKDRNQLDRKALKEWG